MTELAIRQSFNVGPVPVYGDLVLSPMDGYSDLPFRLTCRALGELKGQVRRIGLMGYNACPEVVDRLLEALKAILPYTPCLAGSFLWHPF